MKIAVVLRKGIEQDNMSVEQFFKFARKFGFECNFLSNDGFDLLVTFGGDGTTLHYAKKFIDKPIVAVNMGHIGFLSQLRPRVDEYQTFFECLSRNDYTIQNRTVLNLCVNGKDYLALNDVMLCSINRGRTIRVTASLNNRLVNTYNCDGVLVSTPTGSTAHNLSCGGSAVTVDSTVFCLTPIAGINNNCPIIFPDNAKLTLSSVKEQTSLYADGDILSDCADTVIITKSKKQAKFVQIRDFFFEKLSAKNAF